MIDNTDSSPSSHAAAIPVRKPPVSKSVLGGGICLLLIASIAAWRFAAPPQVDKPTKAEIDNHTYLGPKPGSIPHPVPHKGQTNPGMLMPPQVLINRYLPDINSIAYIKAARSASELQAKQPGKPITNTQLDDIVSKTLMDSYQDSVSASDFQRVFATTGVWTYARWSGQVPDLVNALRKTAQDAYTKAGSGGAPAQ